jgi:hypothetical protein
MRQILILVITALTINAFGQIESLNAKIVNNSNQFAKIVNDSILQVSYVNSNVSDKKPACYINGKYICKFRSK